MKMYDLLKKITINVIAVALFSSTNLGAMEQASMQEQASMLLEELQKIKNRLDSDADFVKELREVFILHEARLVTPIKNLLQSLKQLWGYRLKRLSSIKFKQHVMPINQFIGFLNKNGMTILELSSQ